MEPHHHSHHPPHPPPHSPYHHPPPQQHHQHHQHHPSAPSSASSSSHHSLSHHHQQHQQQQHHQYQHHQQQPPGYPPPANHNNHNSYSQPPPSHHYQSSTQGGHVGSHHSPPSPAHAVPYHHQPQQQSAAPPPLASWRAPVPPPSPGSRHGHPSHLQSPIQTQQHPYPSRSHHSPPPHSPGGYNNNGSTPARNTYYDPVGGREPSRDWQPTASRYPPLTSPTQPTRQPYMYPEGPPERPRTPPQQVAPRSPIEYRTPHADGKRQLSPNSVNGGPRRVSMQSLDGNYPPRGPEFQSPPYRPPVMASSPPMGSSAPNSAKKGAMSISALLSGGGDDEPRPTTAVQPASPSPRPRLVPAEVVKRSPSPRRALTPPPPPVAAPVEPPRMVTPPPPEPIRKESTPTPTAVPAPQPTPIAAASTPTAPETTPGQPRQKRKYVRRQPVEGIQVNINTPQRPRTARQHSPDSKMKMDIDEDTPIKPLKTDKNANIAPPLVDFDAIDAEDDLTKDVDAYTQKKDFYLAKSRKRKLGIEKQEDQQRKHRRLNLHKRFEEMFSNNAIVTRSRGDGYFYNEAHKEILRREDYEEKERKKEMQRVRRRNKAATEHRLKADAAAKDAAERAEKARIAAEEARKAGKPLITERTLTLSAKGGLIDNDIDSETPTIGEEEKKPVKKKPGKPKRKTEDPKDIAMKIEVEAPPVPIEPVREPTPEPVLPHTSKAYNNMYDQIWKDLARKEIPKLSKFQVNSLAVKMSNHRKTSLLASKEARRWQLRTTKNTKDIQARAKKCMREMTAFWKRNEKEERDMRRRAEKEALEKAKKEEEEREARRQARKLNFLISQTELYSHFIGKKIKTDEVERSTDKDTGEPPKVDPTAKKPEISMDDLGNEVTRVEDLDFDEDDDAALTAAAKTNAHLAIEEARKKAQAFNDGEGGATDLNNVDLDGDEMNFQNPTSLGEIFIDQPKLLTCQLKEYQLKGLNWLVNLYEQGINGILADEMGLGKTVQSISVMAYLAEYHNIWGPFLVIAPASTLHNWQQEIARFVPDLKILPYWGNTKDRKVLRKFWDRKHLTYTKDSPFHVLVTSYQLVVQDQQYFQRIRWQYMILDEAQAIKSSSSARWKSLLAFHCRNRLLLTGTPIQNNMQELWALLHFIMPTLFDSHDEFSEWFSKDIESHAQSNTQLNEAQLRRLHMILKPFMLRRIKKHVQSELGDKIEVDVYCELTFRQRGIYKALRNKINMNEVIEKAVMGDEGGQSLMNLVMQFRKVCNHPDLFERADTTSPMAFNKFPETASFLREGNNLEVAYAITNLIEYSLPRLVARTGRLDMPGPRSRAGFNKRYLNQFDSKFNIWNPRYLAKRYAEDRSSMSFLRLIDTSPAEASRAFHQPLMDRAVDVFSMFNLDYEPFPDYEENYIPKRSMLLINTAKQKVVPEEPESSLTLRSLRQISRRVFLNERLHRLDPMCTPPVAAAPIGLTCSDQGTRFEQRDILFNEQNRKYLYGPLYVDEERLLENKVVPEEFPARKLLPEPDSASGFTSIQVPSMRRFVAESGKLARLDTLLKELKLGGHRVLLYFQMTRMIDLMEEYLSYRQYKYLRLDGSSKLEDRRDMVMDWQTKEEIFIFLLSTRAGGLGINLTAADTVIFYDSDWNPTIDSQAMDRAHRLGQTKQVRVFRLITRGTVEERILLRAKQKAEVQKVVVGGGEGEYKNVDFNKGSREMAMLLLDDDAEGRTLEEQMDARQKQKEADEASGKPATASKGKKAAGGAGGGGGGGRKKKNVGVEALEEMYHEGEGHFNDDSNKPSEASTPIPGANTPAGPAGKKKGARGGRAPAAKSHRRKSAKERMEMADGVSGGAFGDEDVDMEM